MRCCGDARDCSGRPTRLQNIGVCVDPRDVRVPRAASRQRLSHTHGRASPDRCNVGGAGRQKDVKACDVIACNIDLHSTLQVLTSLLMAGRTPSGT